MNSQSVAVIVPPDDSTVPQPQQRLRRKERHAQQAQKEYPVPPTVINSLNQPHSITNHSYRDFSKVPPPVDAQAIPTDVSQQSFPQKLHWLLHHPVYGLKMEWKLHGRAFFVRVPNYLALSGVLQEVLECRRYSVFLCLLQSWGFKLITQGPDRNCWYHELFLRGLVHLTLYMDEPRDARRRLPDPANEPDLYAISQRFPLPATTAPDAQHQPPPVQEEEQDDVLPEM
eukprot:CAMPEP_0172445976 /NCGR_PEP_ID=MMETSP1065-20121228/5702_1 /TAXON_ID=265537 /ORGANISM="Amphiprora paludosa, Strain CCMP125" /LENGTH=227 /DNA_ID=CAMNT_0013196991 /DNA_START=89 /DNA_END=772 /DNA_ORIENTATION=+